MARYELSDGSSNKFWEIALDGSSLTLRWGRVGTSGRTKSQSFASSAEAKAAYEKLVAEKVAKGYGELASGTEPKPKSKPTKAARARGGDGLSKMLGEIEALLTKKHPKYLAALGAPVSTRELEEGLGAPLPAELRQLWSWRNGAEGFFVDGDPESGWDWMAVGAAEDDLAMLRETAPELTATLLPFASDGSGNYLCIDVSSGEIFDWDHETRETKRLHPSLEQALRALLASLKVGKFNGGPEVVAAPNKVVAKAMKLIGKPNGSHKVYTLARTLPPAERVSVLRALLEQTEGKERPTIHGWLSEAEAHAGAFRDAIANAKEAYARERALLVVGALALDARRAAEAEAAFSAMNETALDKPVTLRFIGLAAALEALGKDATEPLAVARAQAEADAATPTDFNSASACYARATLEIQRALIVALTHGPAAGMKHVADVRAEFAQIKQKSVRGECEEMFDKWIDPTDPAALIARQVGLS